MKIEFSKQDEVKFEYIMNLIMVVGGSMTIATLFLVSFSALENLGIDEIVEDYPKMNIIFGSLVLLLAVLNGIILFVVIWCGINLYQQTFQKGVKK